MISITLLFLSPVAGLAMDTALFRFFSLEESLEEQISFFSTASVLKTLTVAITGLILIPFYDEINRLFFESRLTPWLFSLIIGSFIVDNFSSLSNVVLRSQRKVKLIAINSILYVFVSIICSVFFVLVFHMGVLGSMIGGLLASIFKVILYIRVNRKIFFIRRFSILKAKELLNYSLPMVPHKIQANIMGLLTSFMINQKLGLIYSGYYAVATKVARPLVFIVTMVQQSWTPYKFHLHKTDSQPAKSFTEIISLYWIFLVFVWAVFSLFTPYLFSTLINKEYMEAKLYVPFVMFVSLAQAIYFTITTGFELKKSQRKMVLASFFGMSFLVIFSFVFLNFYPPYSFLVLQAFSFFILAFVIFGDAREQIKIDYPIKKTIIFLLITIVLLYINFLFEQIWITIGLVLFLFIVTIGVFKWVLPQYSLIGILDKLKSLNKKSVQ